MTDFFDQPLPPPNRLTYVDQQVAALTESLIRLEAKIDVVLSRHEVKIDDLTRRQGETTATLRDLDTRITQNTLVSAETRSQVNAVAADVRSVENTASKRGNNNAAWVAVAVASLAVVLGPIITSLLVHH